MRHTVLRETWEEPFERPLPNLFKDLYNPLFLKDCVVDATDTQTLSEEGKFRLRILAELDAFVHCSEDVCFAQELVRDVLWRFNSDSECDASSGNGGDFGHVLHVTDPPPLKRRCIQVVHAVDDFYFLGFRPAPTLALATSNSCWKDGTKIGPSSMYHKSAKPPFFLQRMLRVVSTSKLLRAAKLEVG